jgi:DNA-binding NarL/FixJ family response regulator
MAEGRSNHGIAERLVVTERAVETRDEHLRQARAAPRI